MTIQDRLKEGRRLKAALRIMKTDFFPPAPDLVEAVMAAIRGQAIEPAVAEDVPISFRNWVLVGLLILFSLIATPLGVDFEEMVRLLGPSLLLPIALTSGVVVSLYGALFIGSHLEELSDRFGLDHEHGLR